MRSRHPSPSASNRWLTSPEFKADRTVIEQTPSRRSAVMSPIRRWRILAYSLRTILVANPVLITLPLE
jgi:hypothetical protein